MIENIHVNKSIILAGAVKLENESEGQWKAWSKNELNACLKNWVAQAAWILFALCDRGFSLRSFYVTQPYNVKNNHYDS